MWLYNIILLGHVAIRLKHLCLCVSCHQLRLQTVNQPLAVEGNYTATVYSVEPAGDNSSDIVITVATDSPDSPANLTDQLTRPLEQTLEEVTDINEQISFVIETTQRYGKNFPTRICGWLCT